MSSSTCSIPAKDNIDDRTKQPKKRKDDITDELICPITLELPYDPVMADDGRIYDRKAIEEHIRRSRNDNIELKSPFTNENMGSRLVSTPQIKNHIKTLVDDKMITGEMAKTWKRKVEEDKKIQGLIRRANSGNVEDMYEIGKKHYFGTGLQEDEELAYLWFKRAADERHAKSMALAGKALLNGNGVKKNTTKGMHLLTCAAEEGSNFACWFLGETHNEGLYGFPIDKKQARYWYKKSLDPSMKHKHMSEEGMNIARVELQKIEEDVTDCFE